VLELVKRGVDTIIDATRHVHQALKMVINYQTVMHESTRIGLYSQKKVKKP
jgi:hypothetical protein